jgi:hypothetical protein
VWVSQELTDFGRQLRKIGIQDCEAACRHEGFSSIEQMLAAGLTDLQAIGIKLRGRKLWAALVQHETHSGESSVQNTTLQPAGAADVQQTSPLLALANDEQSDRPTISVSDLSSTMDEDDLQLKTATLQKGPSGFGLNIDETCCVLSVAIDGPAARAGFAPGTRIER